MFPNIVIESAIIFTFPFPFILFMYLFRKKTSYKKCLVNILFFVNLVLLQDIFNGVYLGITNHNYEYYLILLLIVQIAITFYRYKDLFKNFSRPKKSRIIPLVFLVTIALTFVFSENEDQHIDKKNTNYFAENILDQPLRINVLSKKYAPITVDLNESDYKFIED